MPLLIVYYRHGCHLCEQMMASLLQLKPELGYEIKQINIDEDDNLRQKFHADIPVVTYQDEVIFYHFFDELALREALNKTTK